MNMSTSVQKSSQRWIVLAASCVVTLCIGSLYAWSAFATPMAAYISECTGKPIESLAIIFTIANAVGPVTMIAGGFINDKLGPKIILLVGGALFGAGMIGSGFVQSVGGLIVSYGLGVGFGVAMIYGMTVSNAVKFFPDKSGFAGGIITAFYGASSIIIPPVATRLVEKYHVTSAFRILGLVMMFLIFASALVIKACPKESGAKLLSTNASSQQREYTHKEMLRQSDFYLLLLTLTCGAFSGMMIISQASQIAQRMMNFPLASAAIIVSVIALFNTMGRLVSGTVSDRLGQLGTLRITFAISLGANILLYFSTSVWLFCLCVAAVGFAFGGVMGIYPALTAAKFGRKHNSVNYGIMFIGFALAGLLGPMVMDAIYKTSGQYQPAFMVAAMLALVGEGLLFLLKRRTLKK